MAVFTAVTEPVLADWLQDYGLGSVQEFRGILSGIENSNFFLTTLQGEYVLTIFEKLTAAELPFYLNFMRHLAARHIPVPDPVPRNDGSLFGVLHGKPAALVTRLQGTTQLAPSLNQCAQAGQLLARMHLAGGDFPGKQANLRSLPWWQATVPELVPFLTLAQRALVQEELAFQTTFFASTEYAQLPAGVCHGDFFRDNALFTDTASHDAPLSGILDFYFAGYDKWLFDVAVSINDWCVTPATGEINLAQSAAWLKAYQLVRPFTRIEDHCWRAVLRAAALRFWVSRLYDFYLPRQAQALCSHDPSHFERILRVHISASILPRLVFYAFD